MTCPHCTAARQRGLSYGGYDSKTCAGCAARSLARGLAAHQAYRRGEPADLHDQVRRVFRRTPLDVAMQMVREWWDSDHGEVVRG